MTEQENIHACDWCTSNLLTAFHSWKKAYLTLLFEPVVLVQEVSLTIELTAAVAREHVVYHRAFMHMNDRVPEVSEGVRPQSAFRTCWGAYAGSGRRLGTTLGEAKLSMRVRICVGVKFCSQERVRRAVMGITQVCVCTGCGCSSGTAAAKDQK